MKNKFLSIAQLVFLLILDWYVCFADRLGHGIMPVFVLMFMGIIAFFPLVIYTYISFFTSKTRSGSEAFVLFLMTVMLIVAFAKPTYVRSTIHENPNPKLPIEKPLDQ
jgi:hypothetical protein